MRLLDKKLYPLEHVIRYIAATATLDTEYDFKVIVEAPWYVRLLSRGSYCAYKTTVYVPFMHLELIKSTHEEDKGLATAKLAPHIMAIHDNTSVGFWKFLQLTFSTKYQAHYFIYEFLFLKYVDHIFKEAILTGFLTSRRNILGFKRSFETVEAYMHSIFKKYSPED